MVEEQMDVKSGGVAGVPRSTIKENTGQSYGLEIGSNILQMGGVNVESEQKSNPQLNRIITIVTNFQRIYILFYFILKNVLAKY